MIPYSSLSALSQLRSINNDLAVTQSRLVSGLKVASAKDNPAIWAKATRLRTEVAARTSVQSVLTETQKTVDIGMAGLAASRSILSEMRATLQEARRADSTADLSERLRRLQADLRSTALDASSSGLGLLAADRSASGYTSVHSFLSSVSSGANGSTSLSRMELDTRRTQLFELGTARDGILQRDFDAPLSFVTTTVEGLSGAGVQTLGAAERLPSVAPISGPVTRTDGSDANAPAAAGLSGTPSAISGLDAQDTSTAGLSGTTSTVSGVAEAAAKKARAAVGTFDSDSNGLRSGDTIEITTKLDGGTARTVRVYLRSVGDAATLQDELNRALEAEFGANTLVAEVASNNAISIQKAVAGEGSVEVTAVKVVDGDDVTTSRLNLRPQSNNNWYDWVNVGAFSITGIDRTDRLRFAYQARDSQGTGFSNDVTVLLSDINSGSDLVTAINNAIAADNRQGQNWSRAIRAVWSDGNVVFEKGDGATGIKVTAIQAINGNGVEAQNVGLTTGSGTGAAAVSARSASATTGSEFSSPVTLGDGATLGFDIAVNDVSTQLTLTRETVDAAMNGQSGYVAGSGTIEDAAALARVVQWALSDKGIDNVEVQADSDNRLVFTKTGAAADGDTLDISNVTSTERPERAASLVTGSDFSDPITIAPNAKIDFTLRVDGASRALTLTHADVEDALSGQGGYEAGSGTIADIDALALVVRTALDRQGVSDVTVSVEGARLKLAKSQAGAGSIDLTDVAASAEAVAARASLNVSDPVTVYDGSSIDWRFSVNGNQRSVRIDFATVEAALSGSAAYETGSGRIADAAAMALVLRRAFAQDGITDLAVEVDGDQLSLVHRTAGAGGIAIDTPTADAAAARAASLVTGSDFSRSLTLGASDVLKFEIAIDGGSARAIEIRKADVDAALAGTAGYAAGSGIIADATALARVVGQALTAAGISSVDVTSEGNRLRFTSRTAGDGRIAIGEISLAGSQVSHGRLNVTSLDAAALDIHRRPEAERNALIDAMIRGIDARASDVLRAEAYLGSVSRRISIQLSFIDGLQSIATKAIGRLVDANISEETARHAALLARRELAEQALQIANSSRMNVLMLFRKS